MKMLASSMRNGFAWLGLFVSISMLFDRYAMIKPVGRVLGINALIAAVCMVALAYMAD